MNIWQESEWHSGTKGVHSDQAVCVGWGLKLIASPGSSPFKSALLRLCKGTQEVKVVEWLRRGERRHWVERRICAHTTLNVERRWQHRRRQQQKCNCSPSLSCPVLNVHKWTHFLNTAMCNKHICFAKWTYLLLKCVHFTQRTTGRQWTLYYVEVAGVCVCVCPNTQGWHCTKSCTLRSARLTDAVVAEPWNLTCDQTHISRTSSNCVVFSLALPCLILLST